MRWTWILSFLLLVQGCANLGPQPVPTPSPMPTFTHRPAATTQQTQTPLTPTPTSDALQTLAPEGMPAREWESIPIMPGALQGQGDDLGYTFTVDASPEQIGDYYRQELPKRGWQYLPYAEGDTGNSMMVFKNRDQTLIISVHEYGGEGLMVIMVK